MRWALISQNLWAFSLARWNRNFEPGIEPILRYVLHEEWSRYKNCFKVQWMSFKVIKGSRGVIPGHLTLKLWYDLSNVTLSELWKAIRSGQKLFWWTNWTLFCLYRILYILVDWDSTVWIRNGAKELNLLFLIGYCISQSDRSSLKRHIYLWSGNNEFKYFYQRNTRRF